MGDEYWAASHETSGLSPYHQRNEWCKRHVPQTIACKNRFKTPHIHTTHFRLTFSFPRYSFLYIFPFTVVSLLVVTSGVLWRLTGNTRSELDPGGYGGVTCPLGLCYCSVNSKLRLKPPAFSSSLVVSHGHKCFNDCSWNVFISCFLW